MLRTKKNIHRKFGLDYYSYIVIHYVFAFIEKGLISKDISLEKLLILNEQVLGHCPNDKS